MRGHAIGKIENVAHLKNLVELNLSDNRISSLEGVEVLVSLEVRDTYLSIYIYKMISSHIYIYIWELIRCIHLPSAMHSNDFPQ